MNVINALKNKRRLKLVIATINTVKRYQHLPRLPDILKDILNDVINKS